MAKKASKIKLVYSGSKKEVPIASSELELAHEIQKHILPKKFPFSESIEVGTLYQPSRFIGGDFYDVIQLDDRRVAFIIGDVSGHSIAAALFMTQCLTLLRTFLTLDHSLLKAVEKTNKLLIDIAKPDMFATAFVGIYDRTYNHLTYVCAGHNPPILVRTSWSIAESQSNPLMMLTADGMALNCTANIVIEEKKIQLYNGDLLLLYTDGLIEIQDVCGEAFGEFKLKKLLTDLKEFPASVVAEKIFEKLIGYSKDSTEEHDDMAALIIKVKEES